MYEYGNYDFYIGKDFFDENVLLCGFTLKINLFSIVDARE